MTFYAQKKGTALQIANLIQNFKEHKYNAFSAQYFFFIKRTLYSYYA